MEKRPVAGIAHSNDTKHRIVRYAGQPQPEIAFEQPMADFPGLLWMNRAADGSSLPGTAQLEAYWTVARKDPSLWPLWFRKLDALSRTEPDDVAVLNARGAVALAQKKDYAAAAGDFDRVLKKGSEEPTTFLNLAAALQGLGRGKVAEEVLERGASAYPYNGAVLERLALQSAALGEDSKARDVLMRYSKLFPEDGAAREALWRIEAQGASAVPSK
jgi:tetratricopeptide (TPR) repeat protein